jgi:hypothetical protein
MGMRDRNCGLEEREKGKIYEKVIFRLSNS